MNLDMNNHLTDKLITLANKDISILFSLIENDSEIKKLYKHNHQLITKSGNGHFLYLKLLPFTLTFQWLTKAVSNETEPYLFICLYDELHKDKYDQINNDKSIALIRLSCKAEGNENIIWHEGNEVYNINEIFEIWKSKFLTCVANIKH